MLCHLGHVMCTTPSRVGISKHIPIMITLGGVTVGHIAIGLASHIPQHIDWKHKLEIDRQLMKWCNSAARSKEACFYWACGFQPDWFPYTRREMPDWTEEYLHSQTRQSLAIMPSCGISGLSLCWDRIHLGTLQPKKTVLACAGCDWEIKWLGVDMRPDATLLFD